MNELQIFNYNGAEVRTVEQGGATWWVAKDVCAVFGETNRNRAMQALDESEKGYTQMTTPGGRQEVAIVNESGLYSMLFAMQPEKARGVSDEYIQNRIEQLKQFRKWVTSEVLPSIHKHGAYMTPDTLEAAILNPDYLLKVVSALKDETDKRKALEVANSALTVQTTIMQPKAEYFDELVDRNLLTGVYETAKQLDIPPKKFAAFLVERKYLYRDKKAKLMPYQVHVDAGLFSLKECFNEKTQWAGTQTLITPKGRETFRLLMLQSA